MRYFDFHFDMQPGLTPNNNATSCLNLPYSRALSTRDKRVQCIVNTVNMLKTQVAHFESNVYCGATHMFSHAADHTNVKTLQMWYHCEGEIICFPLVSHFMLFMRYWWICNAPNYDFQTLLRGLHLRKLLCDQNTLLSPKL